MGRCYNSITVNASADKVWALLRNFHDLGWAAGVVENLEVVGDRAADQLGAKRILNGAFHETLIALNDADRSLQYRIDDGPGPVARDAVANYIGRVRVAPITADGTTFVEWSSSYDSADDAAVGNLCNPIYQALLGALQKHLA